MSYHAEQNNVCNERGDIVAVVVPVLCRKRFARELAELAAEMLNDDLDAEEEFESLNTHD
jgi:hypothetical protein